MKVARIRAEINSKTQVSLYSIHPPLPVHNSLPACIFQSPSGPCSCGVSPWRLSLEPLVPQIKQYDAGP